MRVECARCGHQEDETYEFDVPLAKAQPMQAYEPGKCPECKAPITMHLKRTQQGQRCDLILMPSNGRRGVQAFLLGSETQKVLTHSKIPVLVFR